MGRPKGSKNKNPVPIEDRFWAKVDVRFEDDCWEWRASTKPFGSNQVGSVGYKGSVWSCHRVSYELFYGVELTSEDEISWTCGNTLCVNPRHLYMKEKLSTEQRFWNKVVVDNTGCWLYFGGDDGKGYGDFWADGYGIGAHRYSWILHNGDIPIGLFVCHKCDVPRCVNPDHLFLGTSEENTADRHNKRRDAKGSKSGQAKLTEEIVRQIRELREQGVQAKQLAEQFQIDRHTVSRITRRRSWIHVD